MCHQDSDRVLLERYIGVKDAASLNTLIHRHAEFAFNLARSVTRDADLAEDVVQEVYLKLVRGLQDLDKIHHFKGYLARMIINQAKNIKRRENTAHRHARHYARNHARDCESHETPTRDLQRLVLAALERLPLRYRVPITLCYINNMSSLEAAQVIGVKPATLRSQVSRGLEKLRKRLKGAGVGMRTGNLTALLTKTSWEMPSGDLAARIVHTLACPSGVPEAPLPDPAVLARTTAKLVFGWSPAVTAAGLILGTAALGVAVLHAMWTKSDLHHPDDSPTVPSPSAREAAMSTSSNGPSGHEDIHGAVRQHARAQDALVRKPAGFHAASPGQRASGQPDEVSPPDLQAQERRSRDDVKHRAGSREIAGVVRDQDGTRLADVRVMLMRMDDAMREGPHPDARTWQDVQSMADMETPLPIPLHMLFFALRDAADMPDDAVRLAATDSQGEFSFDACGLGQHLLIVEHAGYLPNKLVVRVDGMQAHQVHAVTLSPMPEDASGIAILTIRNGEPAADATVALLTRSDVRIRERRSNAQGMLHWPSLDGIDRFWLYAVKDGFASFIEGPFRPADASRDVIPLDMRPATSLTGVVVDGAGRQPIPGAAVFMYASVDHDPHARVRIPVYTRTDASGRFALHGVPYGRLHCLVRAKGWFSFGHDVTLAPDKAVDGLQFRLTPVDRVRFRVLDLAGQAQANCRIDVEKESLVQRISLWTGMTDEDGYFRPGGDGGLFPDEAISLFQSKADLWVYAVHPEMGAAVLKIACPLEHMPDAFVLNLDQTGQSLQGLVTDEAGLPMDHARVSLEPARFNIDPWPARLPRWRWTGKDGRFLFPHVRPPGKYRLEVSEDQGHRHREFDVEIGDSGIQTCVFSLAEPTGTGGTSIAGFVHDAFGRPVTDGVVVALPSWPECNRGGSSASAMVNAEGGFTIIDLVKGPYDLHWAKNLGARNVPGPYLSRIQPGTSDVVLPVGQGCTMEGAVTGLEGPAASFTVVAYQHPEQEARRLDLSSPEAIVHLSERTFEITGIEPGTYTLAAVAPGKGVGVTGPWRMQDGDHISDIVIDLQSPPSGLEGSVLDSSGGPLDEASVAVRSEYASCLSRPFGMHVWTDAAGHFRVEDLLPGAYTIRARKGETVASMEVYLHAGERLREFQIRLHAD